MLALGAALGCELSSPSPRSAFSVAHPMGWALALAATWLVSLLAAIGCGAFLDAARHMTIRLLLLGLLCLLGLSLGGCRVLTLGICCRLVTTRCHCYSCYGCDCKTKKCFLHND
jgi:hypothetical protein